MGILKFLSMPTFHFIVVASDIVTDILYIKWTTFHSDKLELAAIGFVIFLPFIVYISTFVLIWKKSKYQDHQAYGFLLWTFIGPLLSFFYPLLISFHKMIKKKHLKTKTYFKLGVIQFLLESLPEITILIYNNQMMENWSTISKVSFAISAINLIRGAITLAFMIDNYGKGNSDHVEKNVGKRVKVRNFFITIECVPMILFWGVNFWRLFLHFHNEISRYILFIFLFFGLLTYLVGCRRGTEKLGLLILLRLLYGSHFDYYMKLKKGIDHETIHPWINEILFVLICLIPTTIIQYLNCPKYGKTSALLLFMGGVNIFCLAISFIRILHHYISYEKEYNRIINKGLNYRLIV